MTIGWNLWVVQCNPLLTVRGGSGIGKVGKILFRLLIALAVAAILFAFWQRDNLRVLFSARTSSAEEIIVRAQKTKERQKSILRENYVYVLPPSMDQIDSLLEGKATAEEIKSELGVDGQTAPDTQQPDAQQPDGETAAPEAQSRSPEAQSLIDACARELYAYEVDLMAELGELKQRAVDEYKALPAEERTQENKAKIGYRYLGVCYDLEVEADRNVKAVLNRLRSELEALDADSGIVDTLWSNYREEKSSAKEYYLNKYL